MNRVRLQIALTNAMLTVPPFRSARYKRWAMQTTRARHRAKRRREE